MEKAVKLTQTINTAVYFSAGDKAGVINELIIDPVAGIVRFASIETSHNATVVLPWATMIYAKSKGGFVLTERGQSMLDKREARD